MNVIPVVNSNARRQNGLSNFNQEPSFKSVIPVRVLIDGRPSVDSGNVKKAMRQLSDMLFKQVGDRETADLSRQMFIHYDNDFHMPDKGDDVWKMMRKKFVDGVSYIFTGKDAEELDKLGRKIGSVKHKGLEEYGTTQTFEAGAFAKSYFDKMREFIDKNKKNMLKDSDGEDLILTISTKSNGKFGKKDFKLFIDYIDFDPIKNIVKKSKQANNPQEFDFG